MYRNVCLPLPSLQSLPSALLPICGVSSGITWPEQCLRRPTIKMVKWLLTRLPRTHNWEEGLFCKWNWESWISIERNKSHPHLGHVWKAIQNGSRESLENTEQLSHNDLICFLGSDIKTTDNSGWFFYVRPHACWVSTLPLSHTHSLSLEHSRQVLPSWDTSLLPFCSHTRKPFLHGDMSPVDLL